MSFYRFHIYDIFFPDNRLCFIHLNWQGNVCSCFVSLDWLLNLSHFFKLQKETPVRQIFFAYTIHGNLEDEMHVSDTWNQID
jgi:hypothetical protein